MPTRSSLVLLSLVAAVAGCSKSTHVASFVRASSIRSDAESSLDCDTGQWRGRITIARDVAITTKTESSFPPQAGQPASAMTLAVRGAPLSIEVDGLRVGSTFVPLSGEVAVAMRSDGIYVQDRKVAELPK